MCQVIVSWQSCEFLFDFVTFGSFSGAKEDSSKDDTEKDADDDVEISTEAR